MSKTLKILLIILGIVILAPVVCYVGLAYYYSHPSTYIDQDGVAHPVMSGDKCFLYGTYINGVYCTGMTVAQVEDILEKNFSEYPISELKIDNNKYAIDYKELNCSIDYKDELKKIAGSQSAWLWYKMISSPPSEYDIKPVITIDEEAFNKSFDKLGIVQKRRTDDDVYIELTDEGYKLVDGKKPILMVDKVKSFALEQVKNGILEIIIDDSFYEELDYSKKEKDLIALFDKIDAFQSRTVTYWFGNESKEISKRQWAELLNTEENLLKKIKADTDYSKNISFEIPKEKAKEFIDGFLDRYNTYNNRYFKTHSGQWVHVKKGNYGNKINIAKEEEWFVDFVNSDEKGCRRTPEYILQEAKYKGLNDFGNTFVEISIDEQHMWYYVDGKIYVETDVTTGSLANGGTAPRVVSVYTKIPNKWLNGPTWHSFVKYWVAIQGAIGIHDASWRSKYGGTEYLYNGSHGCINTPLEAMTKLYDKIELGTPVIVYSLEKNGVDIKE